MTQANYRAGAATTLDVLDAQAALTLAESLRLEALYEHANARAAVRYVMARDPAGDPGRDRDVHDRRREDDARCRRPSPLASPPRPAAARPRRPRPRSRAACPCARRRWSGATWTTRWCSPARCGRGRRCRWWPRSRARLLRVLKDEGARVAAGEVLAVLDETDYRLSPRAGRGGPGRGGGQPGARARPRRSARRACSRRAASRTRTTWPPRSACRWRRRRWPRRGRRPRSRRSSRRATQVRAPFSGRVARRHADAGRACWPRARRCSRWWTTPCSSSARRCRPADYGKVRVGAPVDVTVDALARPAGDGPRGARDAAGRGAHALVRGGGRGARAAQGLVGGLFARATVRVGRGRRARWWCRRPRSCATAADPSRAEVFVVDGRQGASGARSRVGVEGRGRGAGHERPRRPASRWSSIPRSRSATARRSRSRRGR